MNTDPFESKLAGQSFRSMPPEWRGEILAKALAKAPKKEKRDGFEWLAGLRLALGRIPAAWGALGLLWAIILGVNGLLLGPSTSKSAAGTVPSLAAWNQHRAELTRLLELSSENSESASHGALSPAPRPSPRSERRDAQFLAVMDTVSGMLPPRNQRA
jgi:hypothetical protein